MNRIVSTIANNILLIYPPSRTQSHRACPMGMLMLAAVLEQAGCKVHLLDANAANNRRDLAAIVKTVQELKPNVIGITLVTPLVRQAYRLAADLRFCGAKLLAGGPHATLLPEEPLRFGFDAVVVGEGEPTVVEAVEALSGRRALDTVQGLVWRSADGQVQFNQPRPPVADLDALPQPARHLVDPTDYGASADLHAHIFTSRGCPGRCAYCAGGLFGKKFRFRSADAVVNELVDLHQHYGTRHFYFVDDAMSMDRARMEHICRRLIDLRLGATWSMMTRIDAVDEQMLRLAAIAGCVQIDYGIESGNPETLKRIHKPHTVEMVRRVVPMTYKCGIRPVGFFILGFPWEDTQATERTMQLMRELSPYVLFQPAVGSVLVPFPGTEIYDRYKDEFDLTEWWLTEKRNFDAPQAGTHPFYQMVMYRLGVVLDADFFRYSPEMRAKIHDVFRYMYASNFRRRSWPFRSAAVLALDVSRKLDAVSPRLERILFRGPLALRRLINQLRGYR